MIGLELMQKLKSMTRSDDSSLHELVKTRKIHEVSQMAIAISSVINKQKQSGSHSEEYEEQLKKERIQVRTVLGAGVAQTLTGDHDCVLIHSYKSPLSHSHAIGFSDFVDLWVILYLKTRLNLRPALTGLTKDQP